METSGLTRTVPIKKRRILRGPWPLPGNARGQAPPTGEQNPSYQNFPAYDRRRAAVNYGYAIAGEFHPRSFGMLNNISLKIFFVNTMILTLQFRFQASGGRPGTVLNRERRFTS
jgi:hypothetical protein